MAATLVWPDCPRSSTGGLLLPYANWVPCRKRSTRGLLRSSSWRQILPAPRARRTDVVAELSLVRRAVVPPVTTRVAGTLWWTPSSSILLTCPFLQTGRVGLGPDPA